MVCGTLISTISTSHALAVVVLLDGVAVVIGAVCALVVLFFCHCCWCWFCS